MNVLFFKVNTQFYFVDAKRIRFIRNRSDVSVTNIPSNSDPSSLGWNMYHGRVYVVKDAAAILHKKEVEDPKSVIYFDNLVALTVSSVLNVGDIVPTELQPSPIHNKYVKSVLIGDNRINLQIDVDSIRNFKIP